MYLKNMNTDKFSITIIALTLVSVAIIWNRTELSKSKNQVAGQEASSRYIIDTGYKTMPPLLLDKKTGRVWRYYRNEDKTGALLEEGFIKLHAEE